MLLSIIIPAYDAEKYIDRCMASVYKDAPALDDFELVVVNDGSKDQTSEIFKGYCGRYKNITLIDKENEGVSVARNVGIRAAKGDYVLFLDVDDELTDGSLAKLCAYLSEHEPMDMLMTCQLRNDGEKECLSTICPLEENRSYTGVDAYKKGFIRGNAGGGVCRTDFLREHNLYFPEGIKNEEDTIFFILVQVYANYIVFYDLNLYRINEMLGSASRVDYHIKAKNLIMTAQSVSSIKRNLNVDVERQAIFDFMSYKVLRDLCSNFAASKDLNYWQLRNSIDVGQFLPLDVKHVYIDRAKMRLMNTSFPLFYFISWIKQRVSNLF